MKAKYGKWNRDPLTARTRVCRKCKQAKPISEFHYQHKYEPPIFCLNRRNQCNVCHNKQNRKILLRNTTIEERIAYHHRYYLKNKKQFQTYSSLKYMANKQKKSIAQRIKDALYNGKGLTDNYVVTKFGGSPGLLRRRVHEMRNNDNLNIVRTERNGVSTYKLSATY